MNIESTICLLDEIIEKFYVRAETFVYYSCYLPGLHNILSKPAEFIGSDSNIGRVYDHEYFAFTKSTKTLVSIKQLLAIGNNEDVYILIRSIFENYIATRFLNESIKTNNDARLLDEYIENRVKLSLGLYKVMRFKVVNNEGNVVSELRRINSQIKGMDKAYYSKFYGYLSKFSHSDFSVLDYYLNDDNEFDLFQENDALLARLFTVFVMTKLFECVVTIKGEEFYNKEEEVKCYKLVQHSLEHQRKIFTMYIHSLEKVSDDTHNLSNKSIRNLKEMLQAMNSSLEDNIGDFNKEDLF